MQLGDTFNTIDNAREAIGSYILDLGESYRTAASDKKRCIIACKDKACKFRIN